MSAIEIMDPRMDTGMLIEEKPNKFDILEKLTGEETLGIMDRLLTREMAWISGHSLSQTVYTCIYFHHIQTLNGLPMPTLTSDFESIIYGVLKTYVLATEEDFTTNLFGLSFNEQNPDVAIFNDIDSSIMLLNHVLNTSLSEKQTHVVKEILNRMEIRKSFLLSLVFLSQNEGSHLPQAKKELSRVMRLLDSVDLSLGKDVPDAFDSNINRKLTSQTPPRPNNFASFGSTQPYPDAFSRSKLNTLFFHNQRVFGTLPVPRLILASVEEIVRPPAWWLSSNQLYPDNIDGKELLNAHETLKAYLDRISMVTINRNIECKDNSV
ncbi:Mak10 subunit, NatC N-terminal acetyltransferase-domain-containing protein [Mucor mucedo]|uniref:Mak10 subunit, NatC N-terminal acetyltransferase-domain-containing protein n=1 Tax=Mucor mucedo TaxID=29922 RepID=UPI00221EA7A6|nr:Mak10 subunit, NatC N-terminal acetyltransferase-domain-containing protein [Mucor mucedo]KAI7889085.1 Mak10 subunit, NatC N-terminal acetyltransferase-domain-containing protein [Mucor mucedo]